LTLKLAGGIADLDGNPATLGLVNPVYAIAFDPTADHSQGDQTALTSRFEERPTWIAVDGFALQLGDPGGSPAFEVDTQKVAVTSVHCAPALIEAAAPLTGSEVATRPLPLASGSILPIVAAPGPTPGWGLIAGPDVPGRRRLSLPDFSVAVVRREDLLSLEFLFYNLALEAGGKDPIQLVRKDATQPAYLVAQFDAPQNIAEQAFLEEYSDAMPQNNLTGEVPTPPPVKAVSAGRSRLAFQLPAGVDSIGYSLESLLDWVQLEQSVVPVALPDGTAFAAAAPAAGAVIGPIHLPIHFAPRIRLPLPTETAIETPWRLFLSPNSSGAWKHSTPPVTLNSRTELWHTRLAVRTQPAAGGPFVADEDLPRKVRAVWSPDYSATTMPGHTPAVPVPPDFRMSLDANDRDQIVRLSGGPTTAYLRQRFFIIVREPLLTYGFLSADQQRGFPYQSIQITTLVTPDLDAPLVDQGVYSFMPTIGGSPFLFHIVGQDAEQQAVQASEFATPLYFVELTDIDVVYTDAVNNYQASGQRTRDMAGQKVAFAQSGKLGDTTLHTADLTLKAVRRDPGLLPPVYPQMESANVTVPAIQQITGQPGAVPIKLYQKYVEGDFGPGGVYVENTSGSATGVNFSADQSGGVATPNLNVAGLSRQFGTVSGTLDKIASGTFDPKDYFGGISDAKLFGVIPLMDLVQAIFGDDTVPALVTNRLPNSVETKLHWAPHVDDYSLGPISLQFTGDKTTSFTIDADIVTQLTGGPPQASIQGALKDFTLTLADVIAIQFNSFSFNAPAGKKLDVSVDLPPLGDNGPIKFQGDLSFLDELRKIIPSNGFQDPPFLDLGPDSLTAGFTLPVPSVGVGVFSIENILLSAALTLPFVPGTPLRFRFAFSERENPFLITVSLLGGGGFFGIALGPDGVEMLEASLEVGANVSIDIVVASGNVYIMAGIYLELDFSTNQSQLTGYLRAGGSLDVLGLISASVEFYLGFTYYFGPPCKIAGEATVTIEVHVLFFSASVHASLRREFSDPAITFTDLIAPGDWDYYCDSFAA
ncbi:MAG: hypothetical protein ABSG53_19085, partial [Thermoguttaceae bacterium]